MQLTYVPERASRVLGCPDGEPPGAPGLPTRLSKTLLAVPVGDTVRARSLTVREGWDRLLDRARHRGRRDPERFSGTRWGLVVLDGAQQVKNPRTQAHRAARGLASDGRLVLTGTPVENRLVDMLRESVDAGTHCRVFTQYTAMGRMVTDHLESEHGLRAPFLHGGLDTAARDRMVSAFQDEGGVLVLSLRAAGFGLNLTKASTVIRYDRWWNPAVEDQATDRAHLRADHWGHLLITGTLLLVAASFALDRAHPLHGGVG